jgi:hypothetical protein
MALAETMNRFLATWLAISPAFISGCQSADVLDATEGVSDVCPVHATRMEKKEITLLRDVEDIAGAKIEMEQLAGSLEAFREKEAALFPFSAQPFFRPEGTWSFPERFLLYRCPRCVDDFTRLKEQRRANQTSQRNAMAWPFSVFESRSSRG